MSIDLSKPNKMDDFLSFYKHLSGKFLNTQELQKCAKKLMGEHRIVKGDLYYQIAEIEFYYYSPQHPDIITYPRNCFEGLWFFHSSGVDITTTSNNEEYGGVLIRSIIRNDGTVICGPQNCVDELFNYIDIYGKDYSTIPKIDSYKWSDTEIELGISQRYIPFYVRKSEIDSLSATDKNEIEIFKLLINKKAEKKYWSIKNKAMNDISTTISDFLNYLVAPYRFYIKNMKHTYKSIPNPFANDDYKYLFKAENK